MCSHWWEEKTEISLKTINDYFTKKVSTLRRPPKFSREKRIHSFVPNFFLFVIFIFSRKKKRDFHFKLGPDKTCNKKPDIVFIPLC